MEEQTRVIEYKCPCCNAGLNFSGNVQQLTCEYCDNTFEIDAVKAFNETKTQTDTEEFQHQEEPQQQWTEIEQGEVQCFVCPSCGGEIITDAHTVASFCPYCDNPTIMPARLSGGLRPDAVLPFKTTKEDAKAAFLKLCKGKPLLPKMFTEEQRLEKITGMYVPFWLYDCSGDFDGSYNATRIHRWSDARYNYTKTDHYLLKRAAYAEFIGIPMDGSSKMDDTFMESIEPFDYSQLEEFDMAYLSGFLADKYDVPSKSGEERVKERVSHALDEHLQGSLMGFATVIPATRHLNVKQSRARYVLLPVWMLNTRYKDKIYTFAMNGQSGKMTGSFPICPKRTALWFAGIWAAATVAVTLLQLMVV